MKRIEVTIKGKSPLLMHSFPMTEIKGIAKMTPEEQAEHSTYRHPDSGKLYIPGMNFRQCLVNGAAYSKGKGRANLSKTVAACVDVTPEYLMLGTKDFSVDTRPVVIKATGGRILRHRPRLDEWQVKAMIEYDDELLSEKQMRQIVDDAGQRVGLLDFRPEKKGPFGRFVVIKWAAA